MILGRAALATALIGVVIASPHGWQARREPVRRALLIGINEYPPGADGYARMRNLSGSVNDAEAMRSVLTARYGFKPENIRLLLDTAASRQRILSEVERWLVSPVSSGDVSVFFFAGHGSYVANPLSTTEEDKRDETIVPSDTNQRVRDIRDKELAGLFNRAIDRGAIVTAILDSCHSGSAARRLLPASRGRFAPPEPAIADATVVPSPESRGALILSAAQDFEYADEDAIPEDGNAVHGLFTWALVKTLRSSPVNENVERTFLRVRNLLRSGPVPQEPVLAGTPARRRLTLFGLASPGIGLSAAVRSVEPDGTVVLHGGVANGLRPGAELKATDTVSKAVVRIETAELAQSRARVVSGSRAGITVGTVFELTTWVAPSGPPLRMWIQDAVQPAASIRMRAVESPERDDFPVPAEVAMPLRTAAPADGFAVRGEPAGIDYALQGRVRNGRAEYAWVRPNLNTLSANDFLLPAATRWVAFNGDAAASAVELRALANRLAEIRYWLQLESPPDTGAHPYHLGLKSSVGKDIVTSEDLSAGRYSLVLQLDRTQLGPNVEGRFVYVIALDQNGNTELLFPPAIAGSVENFFPVLKPDVGDTRRVPQALLQTKLPEEIRLGAPGIAALRPGTTAFILLTTATPLPDPRLLTARGVRSGILPKDPLTRFLLERSETGAAAPAATPVGWSVERVIVRSR
jgi:hypothetical protein